MTERPAPQCRSLPMFGDMYVDEVNPVVDSLLTILSLKIRPVLNRLRVSGEIAAKGEYDLQ